ncbi:chorismate lyase [Alteromonas sp. 5E99-2]|uniref:chorismate--pyruvate lyase family protein n=1 Tax=Alteromonas sp. 5E99-2 TaxID=2817683 RepID=UPI001A990230|nr:chorismate lyase [Alteromonas sp. 5E99-2]MBO1257035.1 chorismate lyase [Alteromonas sp. 5E99-2]
MQHFPTGLDVTWRPYSISTDLNTQLAEWLIDTGSLTERIESHCTHFSVRLLGQGEKPIHRCESERLLFSESEYNVREVVLLADEVPWVFARSIIPSKLANGEWNTMGSAPLGRQLFNDKRFIRSDFDLTSVKAKHFSELVSLSDDDQVLHGRRSSFRRGDFDVLVAEVFLPESPAYK